MKALAIIALCALSHAGPNANAVLSVDLLPATSASDSTHALRSDSSLWVAVRIAQAVGLDGYGFELAYNRTLLDFDTAVASSPADGWNNFLESQGGTSLGFIGRLSNLDSSKVTIGNSLIGSDSSQSPGGGGIVALIRFRGKSASGNAAFSLGAVQLLDWRQQLDTGNAVTGAMLTLTPPPVALRNPNKARLFRFDNLMVLQLRRDVLGRRVSLTP
jgi:hypothetical protein